MVINSYLVTTCNHSVMTSEKFINDEAAAFTLRLRVSEVNGGMDGTRTRDLLRDRQTL